MLPKKLLRFIALGAAALCLAGASHAANESYPERPIKLVVGYVPGGSPDSIARAVGQKLGEILGQPVVIDNRAGAGGTIATALVAKAPADGYTLLLGETGQLVIAPWTTKGLPYSALRDFTPVGMLGTTPLALVTNGKTGIRTVPDLLTRARSNPGRLSYGSSGLGSIHNIAVEVLKAETRTDILHVPYKGSGLSLPAVISGEVPVIMTSLTAALPQVQAGTLNLLAVSSAARYPSLPEVPTIGEFVKGYDYASEMGILAPAGTPEAIVAKLSKAMQEALNSPDVRERLKLASIVPAFSTPAGYAANLRVNLRKYERAVKLARIEPGNNN
jgi:tripartite-type tricarboxylate transporter receptor subunit TctC